MFANLRTLESAKLLDNLPIPEKKIVNWTGPVRTERAPPPVTRPRVR